MSPRHSCQQPFSSATFCGLCYDKLNQCWLSHIWIWNINIIFANLPSTFLCKLGQYGVTGVASTMANTAFWHIGACWHMSETKQRSANYGEYINTAHSTRSGWLILGAAGQPKRRIEVWASQKSTCISVTAFEFELLACQTCIYHDGEISGRHCYIINPYGVLAVGWGC